MSICLPHLPSRVEYIKANAAVVTSGQHVDQDQTRTYRMGLVYKPMSPRGWHNMVCPTFRVSPIHHLAYPKRCPWASLHFGCRPRHQRPRHHRRINHRPANLEKSRNASPAKANAATIGTTMYTYERPNDHPRYTSVLTCDRAYLAHVLIDTRLHPPISSVLAAT